MARTRKALPAQVDVAHLISTGVLASVCPRPLIEEILSRTGKASQRHRLLPAPAVVYYVMALALWREAPLEEVLRVVCEGLQWLGGGETAAVQASKSAISQARSRLGPEVMEQLAEQRIAEARERGELDNLPGAGRPLVLDDDSMVPEHLRMAYRLLKNTGYAPPELLTRGEITDVEDLLRKLPVEEREARERARRRLELLHLRLSHQSRRREGPLWSRDPVYAARILDRLDTPDDEG